MRGFLRSTAAAAAAAIVCAVVAPGCGGDADPERGKRADRGEQREGDAERPAERGGGGEGGRGVEAVPCPDGLAGCRSASGRILYVERRDPDGDGDAHFVLASRSSITAPGITVVDVRADLRPRPLPGVGEELSAAGPVYPGSYGQRQIEAVAVRTASGGD